MRRIPARRARAVVAALAVVVAPALAAPAGAGADTTVISMTGVNEACFAVGEGIGAPADVDAGVTLGLNYPQGPMAWGAALGFDTILATLDALWHERREERFRPAPLLREAALTGVVADA